MSIEQIREEYEKTKRRIGSFYSFHIYDVNVEEIMRLYSAVLVSSDIRFVIPLWVEESSSRKPKARENNLMIGTDEKWFLCYEISMLRNRTVELDPKSLRVTKSSLQTKKRAVPGIAFDTPVGILTLALPVFHDEAASIEIRDALAAQCGDSLSS